MRRMFAVVLSLSMLVACQTETASQSEPAKSESKPEANWITGKVTLPDGKPLPRKFKEINIPIHGISDKAGHVDYSPVIQEDGTFRQQVVQAQYTFGTSIIKVDYHDATFTFNLEPVGANASKKRDSAPGIVQDFFWHVSGPTPYGKENGRDPNNATHWYGMSVGFKAELYRDDIKARPPAISKDSKLTFTFTPVGEMIDGSKPTNAITFERNFTGGATDSYDVNDLLPGKYSVTAEATLPDKTRKKLLLQGPGDYPKYKPALEITSKPEKGRSACEKPLCTFLME